MSLRKEDFLFRRILEKEMDLWLKEGIILPDQKERILARYRLLKTADEKAGPGKLITTISILGAILVGVGVILFIASNWSAIPSWGRLFIVFSSMLASYGFGFYLRYEARNYPRVGASLILLGSLIFGAGMFLIAQIYHITVHYPNGPLLWGLFVLPLAYLLRFKSLISLAILVLLIWLGMEAHLRTLYSSTLQTTTMIPLFFMAGIALWGVGLVHREWEGLKIVSSPYVLIGTLVTFFAGYLLTFNVYGGRFESSGLFVFYPGIAVLFFGCRDCTMSARGERKRMDSRNFGSGRSDGQYHRSFPVLPKGISHERERELEVILEYSFCTRNIWSYHPGVYQKISRLCQHRSIVFCVRRHCPVL
jgi:uncharacterized membrane protein